MSYTVWRPETHWKSCVRRLLDDIVVLNCATSFDQILVALKLIQEAIKA